MTPEEIIREIIRLRDEAAKEDYKMPGAVSLAWNHPGILSYQIKTGPHYAQDMRRAKWLDSIDEMRRGLNRDGGGIYFNRAMEAMDDYGSQMSQAIERRAELKSPYVQRGVLAFGQPLRAGTDWMQAYASTNINAGKMLGAGLGLHGQTPKHSAQLAQQAADDLSNSVNRLTLGIPRGIERQSDPMQDAWEAERAAEERRPLGDLSFASEPPSPWGIRITPKARSLPYEGSALSGLTSGENLSVPIFGDNIVGRGVGLGIDMVTDPATGLGDAVGSLLGRQWLRGAKGLAGEAALPSVFLGVSESMRADAERMIEEGRSRVERQYGRGQ